MPDLPARPDIQQLRHQAKDLLRSAQNGDNEALRRVRAVSGRLVLHAAQAAVAREYGFVSWPKLLSEVDRRELLNARDVTRLREMLAEQPELATAKLEHCCDHPKGRIRSATWRCCFSMPADSAWRGTFPAPERWREHSWTRARRWTATPPPRRLP